jgi:hypothetical protein
MMFCGALSKVSCRLQTPGHQNMKVIVFPWVAITCNVCHENEIAISSILLFMQVRATESNTFSCSCALFGQHQKCLHVEYCREHWSEHDHSPPPTDSDEILVVPIIGGGSGQSRSYFYVCDDPSTGQLGEFVRCMQQPTGMKLTCFSSGHQGQGMCWHVGEVRSLLTSQPEDDAINEPNGAPALSEDPFHARLSTQTHFHLPPTEQEINSMNRLFEAPNCVLDGGLHPVPPSPEQLCKCGQPGNYTEHVLGTLIVYLERGLPRRTQLYSYKSSCGKPSCWIHYDGHVDGLVVHSLRTAFAAKLFYAYGSLFSKSGVSQEAFVGHLLDMYGFTTTSNE